MPRPTFFNLSESKRQKITTSLIAEFSQYPLSQGSVARIVREAEIPRGSFYQYFDDLEDAYFYVLGLAAEKKMTYLRPILEDLSHLPVIEMVRRLFHEGIVFAADHPQLVRMAGLFLQEERRIRHEVVSGQEERAVQFYYDLLLKGRQTGEIASNVDLRMAAFILFHSQVALTEKVLRQMELEEGSEELRKFMAEFDTMLEIILYGITRRD